MRVESNERERPRASAKSLEDVRHDVMAFLIGEAGFAQAFTINVDGFPVGRTMVAPINPDWSVDLVQRKVHRRLGQLRRDPRVEVVWVGRPSPDSVNDRPHVYDFGLSIPRVVFIRGLASFMDETRLVETFERQTAMQRAKGLIKAPARTPDNVREELVGVHIQPLQVRAEGFGVGAQSFTWSTKEQP